MGGASWARSSRISSVGSPDRRGRCVFSAGELAPVAARDRARPPGRYRRGQPGRRGDAAPKALLVLVAVLILPIAGSGPSCTSRSGRRPAGSRCCTPSSRWRRSPSSPGRATSSCPAHPAPRHPAGADAVDDPDRRLRPPTGGVGLWGILAPLGALVFRGVRARASAGSSLGSSSSSARASRRPPRHESPLPDMVLEPDAGAQHRGRRGDRVHAAGAVREAAPGRARRAADRPGAGREPAPEHPAGLRSPSG